MNSWANSASAGQVEHVERSEAEVCQCDVLWLGLLDRVAGGVGAGDLSDDGGRVGEQGSEPGGQARVGEGAGGRGPSVGCAGRGRYRDEYPPLNGGTGARGVEEAAGVGGDGAVGDGRQGRCCRGRAAGKQPMQRGRGERVTNRIDAVGEFG